MSGRETVLGKVRRALGVSGDELDRRRAVVERLSLPQPNLIPARGQLEPEARVALFTLMAERVSATVKRLAGHDGVPAAVAEHLRRHNLPMSIRTGEDPTLDALPWDSEPHLQRLVGPSDGT
jgi:L-lactate dehydrogenase complex protein LldG